MPGVSETTCMVPHFGHSIELRAEGIVVLCSERNSSLSRRCTRPYGIVGLKSEVTAFEACYKVAGAEARAHATSQLDRRWEGLTPSRLEGRWVEQADSAEVGKEYSPLRPSVLWGLFSSSWNPDCRCIIGRCDNCDSTVSSSPLSRQGQGTREEARRDRAKAGRAKFPQALSHSQEIVREAEEGSKEFRETFG